MENKNLFQNKSLDASVIRDCSMARSTFDDVDLSETTFTNVNLRGGKFEDVNLADVAISDANINGLTIFGHNIKSLIRAELARFNGGQPVSSPRSATEHNVTLELPWPWGGELFELSDIRPLNYIVGPLGSGKTRLGLRLAETLSKAVFLGLERLSDDGTAARARQTADPVLKSRVDQILSRLTGAGATVSDALISLLVGLESEGPNVLVIDMIEEGLDEATQEALIAYLRQRSNSGGRPIFFSTRSSAILDLTAVGANERIIFCPANHSPPSYVIPRPGAPSYKSVATCLASPAVRARTAGVVASRPDVRS